MRWADRHNVAGVRSRENKGPFDLGMGDKDQDPVLASCLDSAAYGRSRDLVEDTHLRLQEYPGAVGIVGCNHKDLLL